MKFNNKSEPSLHSSEFAPGTNPRSAESPSAQGVFFSPTPLMFPTNLVYLEQDLYIPVIYFSVSILTKNGYSFKIENPESRHKRKRGIFE